MALEHFKVIDTATKRCIDFVYGWDRKDVLAKVERKMPDYREFCKVNTVALVPATDEELNEYSARCQGLINNVYGTAGTAD